MGGHLESCLVCPSGELFVRKNFSPRLGLLIVAVGITAATVTWALRWPYATYGILAVSALLDLLLYQFVGNLLQCYKCRSEYRGLEGLETYNAFSLETHERFRQEAARLKEAESART